MKNGVLAALLLALPQVVVADRTFLEFDGGIGVIPVSSAPGPDATAETVNRNIVRGVQPPGQIWVIADLDAKISEDGRIRVHGRGLLLGGGNNVGLNGNASVFATLICEAAPGPFVERSTDPAGVPLDPDGDFRISDDLSPWPPGECSSPVLLIRNAANQAWFAAGIPEHDDDKDNRKDDEK
jgi:hypothetical protein